LWECAGACVGGSRAHMASLSPRPGASLRASAAFPPGRATVARLAMGGEADYSRGCIQRGIVMDLTLAVTLAKPTQRGHNDRGNAY
jgi:hypothetical protein